MILIEPKVEMWIEKDPIEHFAKCTRVCYKSEYKGRKSDEKMYETLWNKGHKSVYRHNTVYYKIPYHKLIELTILEQIKCNLINIVNFDSHVYMITNEQYSRENLKDFKEYIIEYYSLSEIEKQILKDYIRHTFYITTNILVTRELNRVSPNNICEQSTRYVNFNKKGEIEFLKPEWWDRKSKEEQLDAQKDFFIQEQMYLERVRSGWPIEEARYFLPLDTVSRVVYTYSRKEWEHILDNRLREVTGKAAPEAKKIAELINKYLNR